MFGGRSVILNEDDASVVPLFARVAYPFAHRIVTPDCLKYEAWGERHWTYPGTQKLIYLHPKRFQADRSVPSSLGLPEGFAIVRFSSLRAHHDVGQRGLERAAVARLASELKDQVRLLVSTEDKAAPPEGTQALEAPPETMHHVMAAARFVLSDSQSMTAEAALLGTPAIRVNDFVGRISYLKELERAGLAFGFSPDQTPSAINVARDLSRPGEARQLFSSAHSFYFKSMPDPLPPLVEMIENLAGRAELSSKGPV